MGALLPSVSHRHTVKNRESPKTFDERVERVARDGRRVTRTGATVIHFASPTVSFPLCPL